MRVHILFYQIRQIINALIENKIRLGKLAVSSTLLD